MASRDDVFALMQQRLLEAGMPQTTKKDLETAFNLVLTCVRDVTMASDSLRTPIGTFRRKEVGARVARNPRTGEAVNVDAKVVLAFKPSSSSKEGAEEVQAPKAAVKAAPKAGVKPAVKVKK